MRKLWLSTCLLGLMSVAGYGQSAQDSQSCGVVGIVVLPWQSGELMAELDKFILEKGYGCASELVSSSDTVAVTSMIEQGKPDIIPEVWLASFPQLVKDGVEQDKLVIAASVFKEGAINGFFIPKYVADAHPDMKTIDDVFKHPELFPSSENQEKGVIYSGPTGWFVTQVVTQLFKTYGGEEAGFVLVDPGSPAGLDGALVKAYERGENWLGYYWTPSSIMGKYEMVKLEHGVEYDEAEWLRCTIVPECPDPKRNVWPRETVLTIVTKDFTERVGDDVVDYLNKRSFDNATINAMLAWMSDSQASSDDAAQYFLREYQPVWAEWVSASAAEKIKLSLN